MPAGVPSTFVRFASVHPPLFSNWRPWRHPRAKIKKAHLQRSLKAPLNPAFNPAQTVASRGSAFPPVCRCRCSFSGYEPFPDTWQHTLFQQNAREYNIMEAVAILVKFRLSLPICSHDWARLASKIQIACSVILCSSTQRALCSVLCNDR